MQTTAIQAITEAVVNQYTLTPDTINATSEAQSSTTLADNMINTSRDTVTEEQDAADTVVTGQGVSGEVSTDSKDADVSTVIDLARQDELTTRFIDLINNPQYWKNPNRIMKLDEALFLPVYDDRSLQQFYNSAKDELIKSAMKFAIDNKTVPVMPTEDQICKLAESKHSEKVAKDLRRAAKNKTA